MKKKLFLLNALALLISGCEDPDKSNDGDETDDPKTGQSGYALETAKGHAFAFYNSSGKWIFSVAVGKDGSVAPKIQDGYVLDGTPGFSYFKRSENEASVLTVIGLKYKLSTGWNYTSYGGHYALKYASAKKGTYKVYDLLSDINDTFPTKKLLFSGTFEVEY